MAGMPTGTTRSFAPLPSTRMVRRSSSMSSMSSPQSSLTLIPVAYSNSMIALSRSSTGPPPPPPVPPAPVSAPAPVPPAPVPLPPRSRLPVPGPGRPSAARVAPAAVLAVTAPVRPARAEPASSTATISSAARTSGSWRLTLGLPRFAPGSAASQPRSCTNAVKALAAAARLAIVARDCPAACWVASQARNTAMSISAIWEIPHRSR